MGLMLWEPPCGLPFVDHLHRPGSHQWTLCHPSDLWRLKWDSLGSHSTANTTYHQTSASSLLWTNHYLFFVFQYMTCLLVNEWYFFRSYHFLPEWLLKDKQTKKQTNLRKLIMKCRIWSLYILSNIYLGQLLGTLACLSLGGTSCYHFNIHLPAPACSASYVLHLPPAACVLRLLYCLYHCCRVGCHT